MKITDFKGIFKKSIATVVSINNPFQDYYEIKLKPASDLKWEAGEHGIFSLPNKKVTGKKWRAFSVASIFEENLIILGTRTGKTASSFKSALINMQPGEKVAVRGPFGWFKIQDETTPLVLIAGGVGITPIRALLKQLANDQSRLIIVIYASFDYYLFENEIQQMVNQNPKIMLVKTVSNEETNQALNDVASRYQNQVYYYLSGSQGFIKAMKKQIKANGVKAKNIINDPFLGY